MIFSISLNNFLFGIINVICRWVQELHVNALKKKKKRKSESCTVSLHPILDNPKAKYNDGTEITSQ